MFGVDMTTLIFAAITLFLFFQLKKALGTKTGEEKPYFTPPTEKLTPVEVPLNQAQAAPAPFKWQGFAEPESETAKAFDAIIAVDPSFTPQAFVDGAKSAYETFITTFNLGDEAALKPHLAPEVFADFAHAIAERKAAGERVDFRFVGFSKANIHEVKASGSEAMITMNFVADVISATYSSTNQLLAGTSDKISQTHDRWSFAKNLTDKNPNWLLVGTQDID
jgi:predicted lipid-binding transport protein (Tim44 family)